jgi:hypothetical protein
MARKASRNDVKINKRWLWRKLLRGPRLNQTPPRKSHSNIEKKKEFSCQQDHEPLAPIVFI